MLITLNKSYLKTLLASLWNPPQKHNKDSKRFSWKQFHRRWLNRARCQIAQEFRSLTTKSWITTNLEHVWSEAVPRCLTHIDRPTDEHAHLLMLYKYHQGNILIRMARLMHIPKASEQFRFSCIFTLSEGVAPL